MKTITQAVRALFSVDEVAREAARRGILNASAYAREITGQVAEMTMKDVEETSIMVAINREAQANISSPIRPSIVFDKVSVETGLIDVTFEKNSQLKHFLNTQLPTIRQRHDQDFFIQTTSEHQVTMIMTQKIWDELKVSIPLPTIGEYHNQVAISITFDESYLLVPNFIYAALALFAIKNINLTEIVSTMTELVVIVHDDYLNEALASVHSCMK